MQVPNSTIVNAITNANSFTRAGIYISTTANMTNLPSSIVSGGGFDTVIRLEVISLPGNGSMTQILYHGSANQRMFIRSTTSHNVWSAWRKLGGSGWTLIKNDLLVTVPVNSTLQSGFFNVAVSNTSQFIGYAFEATCINWTGRNIFMLRNDNTASAGTTFF